MTRNIFPTPMSHNSETEQTPNDMCSTCERNGFTIETNCEHLGFAMGGSTTTSYNQCLELCQKKSKCVAITFLPAAVSRKNCYLKYKLGEESCNPTKKIMFSRKCDLADECQSERRVCNPDSIWWKDNKNKSCRRYGRKNYCTGNVTSNYILIL